MPSAMPIECQRSSLSTMRSGYDTTFGSSKIRAAASNEMPCFRRLLRFFFSSHTKTMCIYRIVALWRMGCPNAISLDHGCRVLIESDLPPANTLNQQEREKNLLRRLDAIHKRVQWIADAEARAAWIRGIGARGEYLAEMERLVDETDRILAELERK